MKILFYYSDWAANPQRQTQDLPGGVGYYRIWKVAEQIKDHEVTVVGAKLTRKGESVSDRWERIFKEYDVFWSCYSAHSEDLAAMFYWRDKLGKKVVLDCDDNYLDVLPSHPLHDKLKATKRDKAFISTGLSFADVITVSTEPLKQRLYEHFKNVYGIDKEIVVIPNMNDIKDWECKKGKPHKKKIVIGYAGSNSHQEDLKMVMPHIAKVMNKHKNVYFESIGAFSKDMLPLFKDFSEDARNRCEFVDYAPTFKEYPGRIADRAWDIGIAPLADNAFTRCKSHIKFMEYSSLKIPVIASRVYPYFMELKGREIITDGETGLLVQPREWTEALELLVKDGALRTQLAENARNFIVKTWQYRDYNFSEVVREILSK